MNQLVRWLRPVCLTVAAGALLLAGVALFIVPTRTFATYFGPAAETASPFLPFLIFGAGLTSLTFFVWYRVLRARQSALSEASSPSLLRPRPPVQWVIALQIVLSFAIFTRTLLNSDVPLDWDEHEHISYLAGGEPWKVITPFYGQENHSLPSLLSYLSMKAFGVSKIAARLPGLVMALLFLLTLNIFAVRFLSPLTSLFCFLFLLVDNQVIYMMHSMRGYIDTMFYTLAASYFAFEIVNSPNAPERSNLKVFAFGGVLLAAALTHPFGGIFTGLLFLTLLTWLFLNRRKLSRERCDHGSALLIAAIFVLLVFAVTSTCVAIHLRQTGFMLNRTPVADWEKTDFFYHLISLFGFVRIWEIKLFAAFVVGLLVCRWLYAEAGRTYFPSLFLGITVGFLVVVGKLLEIRMLESRMLLPFLVPFLVWAGDSISLIPKSAVRSLVILVGAGLLFTPWLVHRDGDDGVPGHLAGHETFAAEVKRSIAPTSERCFSYSGDPAGILYAKNFYFHGELLADQHPNCAPHYHLHYGVGLFKTTFFWESPKDGIYDFVFTDGHGRSLYHVMPVDESQKVSANDIP